MAKVKSNYLFSNSLSLSSSLKYKVDCLLRFQTCFLKIHSSIFAFLKLFKICSIGIEIFFHLIYRDIQSITSSFCELIHIFIIKLPTVFNLSINFRCHVFGELLQKIISFLFLNSDIQKDFFSAGTTEYICYINRVSDQAVTFIIFS